VVIFGYMGRSNPRAILTKCRLLGDMVDVGLITCAIFRDCQLRGVGVVRGICLPCDGYKCAKFKLPSSIS